MPFEHRLHARCGCAAAASTQQFASGRPFALPTSPRQFERDCPFAIDHLALEIRLDVASKSIAAVATIDVRRVDPAARSLPLDAIAFEVARVTVDGRAVAWQYDGATLTVPWDDADS